MSFTMLIAYHDSGVAEEIAFGARMCWRATRVIFAADGAEAIWRFDHDQPHLVLLGAFTTTPDGFTVCRHIRAQSSVPVLMLTAQHAAMDAVRALDLGADDYVTWPSDILELLARFRALLRRAGMAQDVPAAATPTGVWLDPVRREARLGDTHIRLTSTEYRLLEELILHAGAPVTHRLLLERVWGGACVNDVHYLKVFIQRLRRKLGETAAAACIHTEWGVGYSFVPPDCMPAVVAIGEARMDA